MFSGGTKSHLGERVDGFSFICITNLLHKISSSQTYNDKIFSKIITCVLRKLSSLLKSACFTIESDSLDGSSGRSQGHEGYKNWNEIRVGSLSYTQFSSDFSNVSLTKNGYYEGCKYLRVDFLPEGFLGPHILAYIGSFQESELYVVTFQSFLILSLKYFVLKHEVQSPWTQNNLSKSWKASLANLKKDPLTLIFQILVNKTIST